MNGEFYEPQKYQARAVTVMDAETGFVVYENSQHQLMYPASVTKIMTALIVLEEVSDLSQQVVVSDNAVYILPYYAARMNLQPGDSMSVYEALYGLMLPSGNDIANALAEHVSGDIDSFVHKMNQRAAELGAVNTRFVNPCGLPGDGQHVTAYDMATLMREAITHPVFIDVISRPNFHISPVDSMPYGLRVSNTNRMIHPHLYEYNPAIVGGKTGFTNAAQHTLVSYANSGDNSFIISVLYASRDATFSDTANLLEYALSLPTVSIFEADEHSWQIPVMQEVDGEFTEISTATVAASDSIRLPVPIIMPTIRYELDIPSYLPVPVHIGDVVGRKVFYAGSEQIAEIELLSTESVFQQVVPAFQTEVQSTVAATEGTNFQSFVILSTMSVTFLLLMVTLGLLMTIRRRRRRLRLRRRRVIERAARYESLVNARYGD